MKVYKYQDKALGMGLKVAKRVGSSISLFKKNLPHKVFYRHQKDPVNQKKIFMESSHGRGFGGNLFYICRWVNFNLPDYKVIIAAKSPQEVREKMSQAGLDGRVVKWYSIDYMYELATSKYLFNDTTFYPFFIKREEQVYVNTWHGTPLKKLGKDQPNPVASGNVQKNFLLSDYIWVSNDYTKEKLLSSYQLNGIYEGEVLVGPCPRNKVLYDKEKRWEIREKLGVKEEESIVVYMPTWRDNHGAGKSMPRSSKSLKLLEILGDKLPESYRVFYKFHDYVKDDYKPSSSRVEKVPNELEIYDFLSGADVLITDYSSVMFDFCGKSRNVLLYTYDREEYIESRGLYLNLEDLPFLQFEEAESLVEELCQMRESSGEDAANVFTRYDKNPIDNLMGYVLGSQSAIGKGVDFKAETVWNGKKNVGIYAGGLWDNGITISLENMLGEVEKQKNLGGDIDNNYIIFFEDSRVKEQHHYKVSGISERVYYFPVAGKFQGGGLEKIVYYGFLKVDFFRGWLAEKLSKRFYEREYRRSLGALNLDHAVHYTGYDRKQAAIISFAPLERKTIYVHNDMHMEYKAKKNYNKKIIYGAYKKFDNIALVNESLEPGFKKMLPEVSQKIKICPNFIGKERVVELSAKCMKEVVGNIEFHFSPKRMLWSDAAAIDIGRRWAEKDNLLKLLSDKGTKKFINIGRFSYEKGQKDLVEAFDQVYMENNNVALIIIGGYGRELSELKSMAKKCNSRDRIFILGSTPNPFPILKCCDAFVLSSKYEGLGLVVFEAAALSVPVISVDLPVVRRYLGGSGIMVSSDISGLKKGMEVFLDSGRPEGVVDFEKIDQEALEGMRKIYGASQ